MLENHQAQSNGTGQLNNEALIKPAVGSVVGARGYKIVRNGTSGGRYAVC